jgi:hypothetical protein
MLLDVGLTSTGSSKHPYCVRKSSQLSGALALTGHVSSASAPVASSTAAPPTTVLPLFSLVSHTANAKREIHENGRDMSLLKWSRL